MKEKINRRRNKNLWLQKNKAAVKKNFGRSIFITFIICLAFAIALGSTKRSNKSNESTHVTFSTSTIDTSYLIVGPAIKLLNNGNAISLIRLSPGTTLGATPLGLTFKGDHCYGAALNPKTLAINFSCGSGSNPFASYTTDDITLRNSITMTAQPSFYAPVTCAKTGKCYYAFGNTNDSRIMITHDGVLTNLVNTPAIDRANNMTPRRMVLDKGKIYLMNSISGPSTAYNVNVFDTSTETFAASINVGQEMYGMCEADGVLAVSVKRGADGNDVLFYNTSNGVKIGTLAMPGGRANQFNVHGCAMYGTTLYVADLAGVRSYTLTIGARTSSVIATTGKLFATRSFTQEIAYSTKLGKVYATMPNATVYELDAETLTLINTWTTGVRVGSGTIHVIE